MFAPFHRILQRLLHAVFPEPSGVRKLAEMRPATFAETMQGARSSPASFITPLFSYRDTNVRQTIREVKYRGHRQLARTCGTLLADGILACASEHVSDLTHPYLLVPIPLSARRFRQRGFNQCQLLVNEAMRHLPNDTFRCEPHILRRTHTRPQTDVAKREQRKANVCNTFTVPTRHHENVDGASIILIDDVTTTGATLSDARRALKKAGARRVYAVTVAH